MSNDLNRIGEESWPSWNYAELIVSVVMDFGCCTAGEGLIASWLKSLVEF